MRILQITPGVFMGAYPMLTSAWPPTQPIATTTALASTCYLFQRRFWLPVSPLPPSWSCSCTPMAWCQHSLVPRDRQNASIQGPSGSWRVGI